MSKLMSFILVSVLICLGAVGEAQAQALRVMHTDGFPATVETGFHAWTGVKNGTAVVVEVWPTTSCLGGQGEVPDPEAVDGGIPDNFGAIIFNDGAGHRTYSYALSNYPLWPDFGDANARAELRVTIISGDIATCTASTPVTVSHVKTKLGNMTFDRGEVRPGSFNYSSSSGGKVNLAAVVTGGVTPSCSPVPPDNGAFRAPITGMGPAILVGLQATMVTAVVENGTLTVSADTAGDFRCSNIGTYDTVFKSSFE